MTPFEKHFNPRSRVGNDGIITAKGTSTKISIHVPAWGTTGAHDASYELQANFNPRSRVGNDGQQYVADYVDVISIHVPAWGTTHSLRTVAAKPEFQSTFPRGERQINAIMVTIHAQFQSTFPRGERLQISTIFHLYICISSTNSHFSITSFCIFYLIHFFLICFFQLFMVRIFWGFSVYFWFALYRNNT